MRILVATLGSIGDLFPFLVVATALRARGHEVLFASNSGYESLIRMAGFEFRPIWDESSRQSLDGVLESDPQAAWNTIHREMFEAAAKPTFEFMETAARKGRSAILASWSALGADMAHETLGLPLCRVYLSPHALDGKSPRPASCEVAFFPEWFAAPRPGWPDGVRLTGFPLFDDSSVPALPAELESFLAGGAPPVIFTPGSFMRRAEAFFRESLAACEKLNLRAVFLTPYRTQIPALLPPSVLHFKYVSLQRLAPRAAALVHHGGIGTCAQAMRAGIPQLAAPVFFDQFDNARRVEAMGLGGTVSASGYNRNDTAVVLTDLLASEPVKQNCARIAAEFRAHDPVPAICEIVESLA